MMKKLFFPLIFCTSFLSFAQLQDTKIADECMKKADYPCAEKAYADLALKEKISKLKAQHLNNLGTSQRRLGKTAEAFKSYEMAMIFDTLNGETYLNLSSLHAARGSKEKALDIIKKGLEINPENAELYLIRAKVYEDLKKNDLAEKDYQYLQNSAPENFIAKTNYALFKKNIGRLNESLKDYNQLISEKPESLLYNNRADVYLALKKYKEASSDVEKAIKMDPKFNIAYLTKAKLQMETGKEKEGCETLDKAVKLGYERYLILDLLKKCGK